MNLENKLNEIIKSINKIKLKKKFQTLTPKSILSVKD